MIGSILVAVCLLFPQPATAPGSGKAEKNAAALKSIERFLDHPEAGEDARAVMKFAEESDDCNVQLDVDHVLTWASHKPNYPDSDVLVAAFVAGNVRSQLQSGKVADDSYQGLLAVFKVYEKLREANKDLKIPEIEDLQVKEKAGQLRDFLEKAAAERQK